MADQTPATILQESIDGNNYFEQRPMFIVGKASGRNGTLGIRRYSSLAVTQEKVNTGEPNSDIKEV